MSTGGKGLSATAVEGKGIRVGIISTRWNSDIVNALVKKCVEQLKASGCKDIEQILVSGAYELPFAAKSLIMKSHAKGKGVDAVVCIGCLIKGDTPHFEYISEGVSQGVMNVGLQTGVPTIFGILTCFTEEQAKLRAGLLPGGHNHGGDWAIAALEMAPRKFFPSKL